MTSYLEPQLQNAEGIKKLLKEVPFSFTLADGRSVRTLLVYLPIEDGKCSYSGFFEEIKKGILYNFVFKCSEIEKKLGIENVKEDAATELFEKALRKLSQHTAKGELGELLLFTLLDVYFGAPKILSKVATKTSPRMPVFGADAVHGQFENNQFKLYLGESKIWKEFKLAASDAATSIKKAADNYPIEFDLLDSDMDFPNNNDDLTVQILEFLNPYHENDLSQVIHSPCFIGFNETKLISDANSEEEFVESYSELACDYVEDFFAKIENKEIDIGATSLIMLPFTCIDDLVSQFIDYLGIAK